MAQISFINLTKDISHEVEDLGKFENDLNKLYDKWETKNPEIFSNFRPVILNEDKNEIIFNEDFLMIGKIRFHIQKKTNISSHLLYKAVMG